MSLFFPNRQFATAAIENSKATTPEIWLTVVPQEEPAAEAKPAE